MPSESRDVQDFSKIELLGAGEIHLVQANHYELRIEASEAIMAIIRTEVKNKSLIIKFEENSKVINDEPIRYFITMPTIEVLRIAGAGSIHAESLAGDALLLDAPGAANFEIGRIAVNAFQLNVTGAVKMTLKSLQAQGVNFNIQGTLKLKLDSIHCDALTSNIEGTCNIEMAGQATAQIIHAPDVINYQAGDVESSQATINAKGMANLTLSVHDVLTISLEGVGNVAYYGNPERSMKITGMGKVRQLGEKAKADNYTESKLSIV